MISQSKRVQQTEKLCRNIQAALQTHLDIARKAESHQLTEFHKRLIGAERKALIRANDARMGWRRPHGMPYRSF